MHVGKLTKRAMMDIGANNQWLADRMGISVQRVTEIRGSKTSSSTTIERLAAAFDMKESEFIALGE